MTYYAIDRWLTKASYHQVLRHLGVNEERAWLLVRSVSVELAALPS